jgi:integrase/recombinase XerD
MANIYKKKISTVERKTGAKSTRKSRKWWGKYRDASNTVRRVPLSSDKAMAQAMLSELVKKVEREKSGLADPYEDQRKRPVSAHVDEFEKYLKNKGVTPKQVKESTTQIRKMVEDRRWKLIGDISASSALDYLGGLRELGRSAQTYNHYLKSAKQFTRWLVKDHRTPFDPLGHLPKLNVRTDRRHDRRALHSEEFALLVKAADSGPTIEAIPGRDRAMMYILAAWTGFRKGEIGSLTIDSFRLDDEPPIVTVAALYSKHRRQDSQVLHPEVVRLLKQWITGRKGKELDPLLFPVSGRVSGGKERKTHKMMQCDLKAARKEWLEEAKTPEEKEVREKSDFLKYQDRNGLFADFHSNRHLFITSLERSGASPKMAQILARHSDIRLTLGVYTHLELHDQTLAIGMLKAPPVNSNGKATKTTEGSVTENDDESAR